MTTAIRLYRTYILSTFVPLNTIRTVSGLLNFFSYTDAPHFGLYSVLWAFKMPFP